MIDTSWVTQYEANIRISVYFLVLIAMGTWEHFSTALPYRQHKAQRWFNNISLSWIGGLCVRLILPTTAVGVALFVTQHQIGILNPLPFWLKCLLSLVLLDALIYWQHRLFHKYPILWRLHSTHHFDTEVDASTGARFHPIEIILSMLIKIGAISILGCPPLAVLLFEVILNTTATFNHSNIRLPKRLKRFLQCWLITPEVHRIHHSINPIETHSNYGFCLSIWDKLFNTYRSKPLVREADMSLGLPNISQELKSQSLVALLAFPFRYKQ